MLVTMRRLGREPLAAIGEGRVAEAGTRSTHSAIGRNCARSLAESAKSISNTPRPVSAAVRKLRVGEARKKREAERIQEALEGLVDGICLTHPVGDHGEANVVGAHLARQEQVADEARRGMDIDCRRRDRDDDRVGARQHLLEDEARSAGGRVDDELLRAGRDMHIDGAQPVFCGAAFAPWMSGA